MLAHRLVPERWADDVADVADSLVALHSTIPATTYLSVWARMRRFAVGDLENALYADRSLIRHLVMRRTVFVMDREVLADAVGAVGARVAASERTAMLRDLRRSDDFTDPDVWIDAAVAAIHDELGHAEPLGSTELRQRLPQLAGSVQHGAGRSWGGVSHMGPRVLNMMCAAGEIVRGPGDERPGAWMRSRLRWTLMDRWLGEPLNAPDIPIAHRAMVGRWLAAFGPGTETDIVWWLGSTKTRVRAALADLGAVACDLDDGSTGYLLPDDPALDSGADLSARDPAPEPRAVLLPELDPTTMGHKDRGFYLGDHGAALFDRTGNGGPTAWWDGRIVGGWYQLDDATVAVHPLEWLPANARKALNERADELTAWLDGARPQPRFASPFLPDVERHPRQR